MLIRYTTDILYGKPESPGIFLAQAQWRETDASFDVLMNLYRMGHVIRISDTTFADGFIIDIDGPGGNGMPPEMADRVHGPSFAREIKALFDADEAIIYDSASRRYDKQKIFVRKRYEREISENADLAYRRFRLKFEAAFGITCDFHMDSLSQITWPCRDPNVAYSPETLAAIKKSIKSRQSDGIIPKPQKTAKECPERRRGPSEKAEERGRFVPLNQWIINLSIKREPRPDIYRIDFYPFFHTKNGRKSLVVPIGKRNTMDIRIIAAAAYYAHYANARYGMDYREIDCVATVTATIRRHFEAGSNYLDENAGMLRLKIEEEWNKCSENFQAYGRQKTILLKGVEKIGYSPRSGQAATAWNIIKDELMKAPADAVKDLIGYACDGDAATMNSVYRKYRAARKSVNPGFDGRHRANYDDLVKKAPRDPKYGRPILPRSMYQSKELREFLRKHGIRCHWTP